MDLEGFVRKKLWQNEDEEVIKEELVRLLKCYKELEDEKLRIIAEAVIEEVKKSIPKKHEWLFSYPKSGITMNEMGVGSRGEGDFFVHKLLALLTSGKTLISPKDQDDAGVVEAGGRYLVVSVDGTHSRLSEYPFLAGFHVARAAVRDVLAMGGKPKALFCDLHLADDGDVSKLFDFMAGVSVVSESLEVPIVAGSTLRIGGDMVVGERMVSCVGCCGIAERIFARKYAKDSDVVLMTQGAGGGTVTTTAIFSGRHEVALETINLDFSLGALALLDSKLEGIHALTDVTNGGLRGDCFEISKSSMVDVYLDSNKIKALVNPKVLKMFEELGIDYLGVSIDSLLVICSKDCEEEVKRIVSEKGIKIERIGYVKNSKNPKVFVDGREISPKFRESAYTKIKKVYGEKTPEDFEEMKEKLRMALEKTKKKKKKFLKILSNQLS